MNYEVTNNKSSALKADEGLIPPLKGAILNSPFESRLRDRRSQRGQGDVKVQL
jgi:hypothetical protein